MKFLVTVQRTEYKSHEFEVEADSPEAAEDAALDAVGDFDFNCATVGNAEESVVSVKEKK